MVYVLSASPHPATPRAQTIQQQATNKKQDEEATSCHSTITVRAMAVPHHMRDGTSTADRYRQPTAPMSGRTSLPPEAAMRDKKGQVPYNGAKLHRKCCGIHEVGKEGLLGALLSFSFK